MIDAASGPPAEGFTSVRAAAAWLSAWLQEAALPLWAREGVEPRTGAFCEALTLQGTPFDPRRRTRVQARQTFVYATAAAEGWGREWLDVARRGFDDLVRSSRRDDGLYVNVLTPQGQVSDPVPRLYEHAFVLLALSALVRAAPEDAASAAEAQGLRGRLQAFRHAEGGFREAGEEPFQANAQMHLFEAALAWEGVSGEGGWRALADELAELALSRLIDPQTGAVREVFDDHWRPLAAQRVEPGHQFEWAWLLSQWGGRRTDPRATRAAGRLYQVGLRGFDPSRGVVVDRLRTDLTVEAAAARLWGQTEFLRASLVLGGEGDVLRSAGAVARFLDTPRRGVWRERMAADGAFLTEPAPATSLYHLLSGILELTRAAG